jgi:hypothetical protein
VAESVPTNAVTDPRALDERGAPLESTGSSLDRLVQVHAMIYDRIEYDVLNRLYRQYVPKPSVVRKRFNEVSLAKWPLGVSATDDAPLDDELIPSDSIISGAVCGAMRGERIGTASW